jgi:transposase InsO family protein
LSKKEDDWRKPFIDFILDQLVPDDKAERERITRRSANYVVVGSDLYRKAASTGILMKCILRPEGLQLLAEIHSGECGCCTASTNLVGKAYQSGFYWPTAVTDAKDLIKRCKGCQFFAKQQHLPAQTLRNIPPSWPFAMWGLDAVGPFRTAPGGYKHILVAVEKFTKWIEVRPVVKVTSEETVKFIADIKHRFVVPNRIITDLGKAFTGSVFWDFCQDNLIEVYYSSVAHPRYNGQVERANNMVLQALKDRIYNDASNYATRWLAKLPHVIWGLRTQVSSATGFSPFFLVYRSEAMLPTEGPIWRTREGGSEWEPIKILLEGDRNSNKMNTASNTRLRLTTQIGQAHVATEVPLDLGTNTQPSDPRTQRNTKPRVH